MCTELGLAAADLERNDADTGKAANSQCSLEEFRVGQESCVERELWKLHRNWTAVHHVYHGTCSVVFATEKACRLGAVWREVVTVFGIVAQVALVRFVQWTCVH